MLFLGLENQSKSPKIEENFYPKSFAPLTKGNPSPVNSRWVYRVITIQESKKSLIAPWSNSEQRSVVKAYSFTFFWALAASVVEVFKNWCYTLCMLLKATNFLCQSPRFPLSRKVGRRTVAQLVDFFHLNSIRFDYWIPMSNQAFIQALILRIRFVVK